jgi:hypothetical protein
MSTPSIEESANGSSFGDPLDTIRIIYFSFSVSAIFLVSSVMSTLYRLEVAHQMVQVYLREGRLIRGRILKRMSRRQLPIKALSKVLFEVEIQYEYSRSDMTSTTNEDAFPLEGTARIDEEGTVSGTDIVEVSVDHEHFPSAFELAGARNDDGYLVHQNTSEEDLRQRLLVREQNSRFVRPELGYDGDIAMDAMTTATPLTLMTASPESSLLVAVTVHVSQDVYLALGMENMPIDR